MPGRQLPSLKMEDVDLYCVNHPGRATRVRCSACNSPICVRCMRESAVGMKCPSCARPRLRAHVGEARRWVAGLAGLGAAAVAGALLTVLRLGALGFIMPIVVGLVTGSVVRAAGRRRPGLAGTAAVATVCGLALGPLALGVPFGALLHGGFLISTAIAAVTAAFIAGR
jgi:hypothetical protein